MEIVPPRRKGKRRPRDDGFTLVEVIISIAILAGGLTVLLVAISGGLRQGARAEQRVLGGALAQSLLAEMGASVPLAIGERSGQSANGLRWRVTTQPFGDSAEREAWPVGAYVVSAHVSWDDGAHEQSLALTTLRLGRKGQGR